MDEELHFKTGLMGRMARFFAARRALGDPYEETLILPAAFVIAFMRLNDLKRVDALSLIVVLLVAGLGAGVWLGACLGMSGNFRALLRGLSAGAIEAAGYTALNDTLDRHQALTIASELIYINMVLVWFGHFLMATVRDIALIYEPEWQRGVPRRKWIYKVYRIVAKAEKLEGADDSIVAAVWAVWLLGPFVIMTWIASLFGVSPLAFIRRSFAH